jgi:hypothetical protein
MPLRLTLEGAFQWRRATTTEAENENESRFQRFFPSAMKPGPLPQAKAKETAPLARQYAPGLCYSRHPDFSAALNLMLISDVSVR